MWKYSPAVGVLLLAGAIFVDAAPAAEEISSLPGWTDPLPSKMYSGFINVSAALGMDMHVHYWYIESEKAPATDATILWTNGGPGASSMFGLLVELGPLLLNEESIKTDGYKKTGVPSLFYNDFGWTKLGSVLMFDWPPPVGFSYCNDPTGKGNACGAWDDDRMAKVSYAALAGWYDLFPERRPNDLYLTGESYAGIYVPKLAQQILAHADPKVLPQLKGMAVGDGCLGTESGVCGGDAVWWHLLFLYGHGQISSLLYDDIVATCSMAHLKHGGPAPHGCDAKLAQVAAEAGGYFAYSLYDDCIYQEGVRRRSRSLRRALAASAAGAAMSRAGGTSASPLTRLGFEEDALDAPRPTPIEERLGDHNSPHENNYKCAGDVAVTWSNASAVRKALHVPESSYFFNGDNGEGMTYHLTEKNLMPFYQQVAKTTKLRVLVYNGDADPSIDSFKAQNWTAHLGFTPSQPWRPWTLDGCRRMGGYVTRYEERFDYLTIRGAGHMVPQFKPEPAFQFLQQWLAGENFKPYVRSCKAPNKAEL